MNVLAVYTGFGLFMGAITPSLLLIDIYHQARHSDARQWRWPLVALLLSLASVYAFSIGYRPGAATDGVHVPMERPWEYPWFVALMLSRFLGVSYYLSAGVSTALGLVALTFLIAALARHARIVLAVGPYARRVSTTIVILIGYTLLFTAATTGRICRCASR